jgi:hypothetical protein
METKEMIELWKKESVDRVEVEFSCGGDSMNELIVKVHYKDDSPQTNDEVFISYFEDKVYDNVTFYECSDGEYLGEFGTVEITYEDGDNDFEYMKYSKSEHNEVFSFNFKLELEENEIKFLERGIVSGINGGEGFNPNINYSTDCIITDKDEIIIEKLLERIDNKSRDFDPEGAEGEAQENYNWEVISMEIEDGCISIEGGRDYYIVRDSE